MILKQNKSHLNIISSIFLFIWNTLNFQKDSWEIISILLITNQKLKYIQRIHPIKAAF